MNRRKFLQVTGLGIVATLASQILAACGGGSSGGSTTADEDVQYIFTVSGPVNSGAQTAVYRFEIGTQHSLAQRHATEATAYQSAMTAAQLWNDAGSNPGSVQIQGYSGHPHTVSIPQAGIRTVGQAVTITSSVNSDHPHDCIITLTSLV